jgi:glycosyltransferase involved in cell wall biosynthesis
MRVLIASSHPYIPQIAGGTQSITHELALHLRSRGHAVAVLAGLIGTSGLGLRNRLFMKLTGRKSVTDRGLGYAVYRAWFAWEAAAEVCVDFRPHAVVLQAGHPVRICRALRDCGAALVPYLHNAPSDADLGGDPGELAPYPCLSNSQFTAAAYRDTCGIRSAVIYPFVNPERYRTRTDRSSVLFVNPVPEKGVDIAIGLARRCPDIPFLFVEAWTLDAHWKAQLKDTLAALPNVRLVPRTRDMRSLYARARIVLAPSRWEETFGRIAAEAHVSGIPVLASDRGGLPEAVGPGGMLIASDAPLTTWAAALRRMWDDRAYHRHLTNAALAHSRRPEIDCETQLARFVELLQGAITQHRSYAGSADFVTA